MIPYKFENTKRTYFPDIRVKLTTPNNQAIFRWFEVKSQFTYLKEKLQNECKWLAAAKYLKNIFDVYIWHYKEADYVIRRYYPDGLFTIFNSHR